MQSKVQWVVPGSKLQSSLAQSSCISCPCSGPVLLSASPAHDQGNTPPKCFGMCSFCSCMLVLNGQVHGCRPRMDSKLNTITFAYTILQGNSLPDMNGTANTVAAGNSMNVLPYVTPGSTL